MYKLKYLSLALLIVGSMELNSTYAATGLTTLSDEQMSETIGQALMSLTYLAPTDSKNLMGKYSTDKNIGFYKLGMEAEMEMNTNIKNLQLGCGGTNGAGACDVEIKNLSLSGLPAGYNSSSADSPNYGTQNRAETSAKLTNPFMEFAISNPDSASKREVVGLRFSAEKITGLLTAGLENLAQPSSTDGIQTLSGFMRIASTTGEVNTAPGKFGTVQNQSIGGYIDALGKHWIQSYPNSVNTGLGQTTGITIPGMQGVGFTMPSFQVNGNRLTTAIAQNVSVFLDKIPLARPENCSGALCSQWDNDKLYVNIRDPDNHNNQQCIVWVCNSTFKMGEGSTLSNLNMNVTFKQALSMFHNIPLEGNGGYLSLQQIALLWPGSYVDSADTTGKTLNQMTSTDVAQKGWWMSFAEPVNLGYLKGATAVDISSVLPQVATLITQDLTANPISLGGGDILNALFSQPITKKMNIDIGAYTKVNPATLTLENLKLVNQNVVTNCYGSLKFC
ncbi:hypothetical protein ACK1JC_07285 [Acinetobacter sp. TY2]|uniref:hypothetical protein n=1 Tax=Acinetobacter sp. TY2 TaxID=3387403 RepID=UPI0039179B34